MHRGARINGRGFTSLNAVEAWLSSLPGHVYANVRQPVLHTLNLVHMMPMSAVWAGPAKNEHLDGRKVYIQFPARLDQGEAPPLFALDGRGKHQLVNYRVRGTYYIVDRLFAAAELRFGEKPQQVVRIIRTDAR